MRPVPERPRPPDDITPHEFFTVWIPATVAEDHERRLRLGDTAASMVFVLSDLELEAVAYTLEIEGGRVWGRAGRAETPDLEVHVDVTTWRALNRGELSAPEALLRRRLRLSGNLVLALKLHVILG
jgi:putative sterol carrier protein